MNHKQIEAFRSVMMTGSMTVTAAQLFPSRPNVSRLISQLERDIGLKLFRRVSERLVPTLEAEALYPEVERSFIGIRSTEDAAFTIKRVGTGALRIKTISSVAIGLLRDALARFRMKFPDVPVSIHISDSPTVSKWIASGFCDLGLVAYVADVPSVEEDVWHRERVVCIVLDLIDCRPYVKFM